MLSRENLNCSFESGFCNWENCSKNKIPWQPHQGATPSFGTGPEFDYTTKTEKGIKEYCSSCFNFLLFVKVFFTSLGTACFLLKGTYLYMEASSARNETKNEGDIARLISPIIRIPRLCFSMHYNMFGKDMGQLKIGMLYENNSEVIMWKKTGNMGQEWQRAEVSFESEDNFQVKLRSEIKTFFFFSFYE